MKRIRVLIEASDPLDRAGIAALLRSSGRIAVQDEGEPADVLVVAEHIVGPSRLDALRRARAVSRARPRCVVVADRFDERDVLFAAQCGVTSLVPGPDCTAARLVHAVLGAAEGHSTLPRPLQSALLRQLDELRRGVLEPTGRTLSGLDHRELDTIRLVAEGLRTDQIAVRLACSDGTVKNVLQAVMQRLGLTNRSHVVAYAIRSGALT